MLRGYADPISTAPGHAVDLMVSTDAREFSLEVVRLLHGDPNPAGPGYQDEATDWVAPGPYPGRVQAIHPGSYLTLPPPGAVAHQRHLCLLGLPDRAGAARSTDPDVG